LMQYKNGDIKEISEPVSTSCYRTPCDIILSVEGTTLKAHAQTSAEYHINPDQPEVVSEVNLETNITPNDFGGIGIQYLGGATTMIREMRIEWK
ncbi:MAG: hypothetical protein P8Y99_13365, partial [Calditrichaceae bacterium]